MFTLVIEDKHGQIADEYSFDAGDFIIGRSRQSDIILPSDNVSRRHARLYTLEGQCFIEDLESSNGVFVNGRRVFRSSELGPQAQIKVGDFYLHVEATDERAENGGEVLGRLQGRNLGVAGRNYTLTRPVNLIGRGRDCTTTIIDPSVSRNHAQLSFGDDGAVQVRDLKSVNGTFVNGRRIEQSPLQDLDRLRLGNVELVFEMGAARRKGAADGAQRPPQVALDRGGSTRVSAAPEADEPLTAEELPALEDQRTSAGVPWMGVAAVAVAASLAVGLAFGWERLFGGSDAASSPTAVARAPEAVPPVAADEPAEAAPPEPSEAPPAPAAGEAQPVVAAVAPGAKHGDGAAPASAPPQPGRLGALAAREPAPVARKSAPANALPAPQGASSGVAPAAASPAATHESEAALLKQGESLLAQRSWAEAEQVFQRLRQRDPLSSTYQALHNKAVLEKSNQERLEAGRRMMSDHLYGHARKTLAQVTSGSLYWEEAQAYLKKLREMKRELVQKGDSLCKKRDWAACRDLYTDALAIDPLDKTVAQKLDKVRQTNR